MRIDVRRGEPRAQPPEATPGADPRRAAVVRKARSVLCVVGTRPEVIKMAPVIRALRNAPGLAVSVLSSGQHRDLLAPLIDWFALTVVADLRVMVQKQDR